jgi:hypothetical protein
MAEPGIHWKQALVMEGGGMTGRKCSTCKHYEPAPIWRKGWCRNPLLYSPQQSHLVGEEDLDCERGMGNYWEGTGTLHDAQIAEALHVLDREPVAPLHIYGKNQEIMTASSGRPVYTVSGSSDYRDDPPLDDPADGRPASARGGERQLEYYSDERYWTDYLRIILPILGVLLFLVLLYLWALTFLRDDEDTPGQAGVGGTPTLSIITADATETPRVGATGTPRIVVTAPPIQPTEEGTGSEEPTAPPDEEAPGGDIYVGAIVQVANTGGTGANMRSEPTTDGEVVDVLLDGTELEVIGESQESQGFVWWNVSGEAGTGWIVADYLVLVE